MGFQQIEFLFLFLPAFLVVYYLMPARWRNAGLVLGSLVFYGIGTWKAPWCMGLLLIFTGFTWLIAPYMRGRKFLLAGSLGLLFGSLLAFKYLGLFGIGLVLPLGMSFFCFQMAAYLIDVFVGRMLPERSYLDYAAGILLFPKLLSGPLMDPRVLSEQIHRRSLALWDLDSGLRDFIIGLSLKVLLADRIGALWSQIGAIGYDSISAPLAWEGLLAYGLQLYFDFCGYSYMALGIGRMLGFRLPENFNHPYAAWSIRDFWRRWHITLGSWFTRYVYIPMGGSRKGTARLILSTLTVWAFTGIWHGSSLNYVVWGLLLGLLILNERLWMEKVLGYVKPLGHLYTVLVILLSWLFFSLPDLPTVWDYLGRLLDSASFHNAVDFTRYGQGYLPILFVGSIFALPLPLRLWKKIRTTWLGTLVLLVLFWACVYCVCVSANDPFMYFSF